MNKFNFLSIFLIVLLAEIPCILRTVAIQLRSEGVWEVVWGTVAGSAMALLVGIGIGYWAGSSLPSIADKAQVLSGFCMIFLGLWLLIK